MKRKLLMTLLTLTLALCSILGLTACGHEHRYTTSVTAPTCTEQGYTTYTCSCGDSYVDDYVDALGHDFKDYIYNNDAKCEEDGTETATCDRDNCDEIDTRTKNNSALKHNYVTPSYTWNGDKCTAIRICANDNTHKETETVTAEYVKDTNATCLVAEKGHYKATFSNSAFEVRETEENSVVNGEPLKHNFGTPTYKWSGNQCTATRVCLRDNTHVETEKVTAVYVKDTDVTCDTPETGHYKATFENSAFIEQNTEKDGIENGCALNHDYNAPIYTWKDDKCTAKRVCKNDITHVESETVTGTYEKDTDATCTEPEKGHYVATFINSAFTTQATATNSVDKGSKKGHSFTDYNYNNNATCTENGTETATCDRNNCNETDTREKLNTKLGHNYETSKYSWSGDKCTATRTCGRDSSHKETEIVTAKYVKDTDATCTEPEKGHYVATFTNNAFTTQTTATNSVDKGEKLGHSFTNYIYNNNATCTENGTETATCGRNNCNETDTREKENSALGHDWDKVGTLVVKCTLSGGTQGYKCDRCNVTKSENVASVLSGAPDAHSSLAIGDICTHCGKEVLAKNGSSLVMKIDENNYQVEHYSGKAVGFSKYKDYITSAYISESVTEIGNDAFYNYSKLTSVLIPNSVTTIGNYVFYGCTSLECLKIPDSVLSLGIGVFEGCTGLKTLVLSSGLTTINEGLLAGCSSLESLTIPFVGSNINATEASRETVFGYIFGTTSFEGAVSIKQYYSSNSSVYYYLPTTLTSVTINGGDLLRGAFYNCSSLTSVTIGDSVTSIGTDAFEGCSSLTSVVIPDSVTSIGSSAFYGCSKLTKVNYLGTIDQWAQISFSGYNSNPLYYAENLYINDVLQTEININAEKINHYAFNGCTSLTNVTIGNSVTSIGSDAFEYCSSLTSIEIPNSVTSIGSSAFYGCNGLTKVNYTGTIDSWAQISFSSSSSNPICYAKSLYINDVLQTETTINASTIKDYAFYNCSSLTNVTIPNSVTSIGTDAFYNCSNLTKVNYTGTIDQWVQISFSSSGSNPICYAKSLYINDVLQTEITINGSTIKDYAFYNCSSLTNVTIPNSVTSIGRYAFAGCSSLTEVTIPNSVTSIGDGAFYGWSSLVSISLPFVGASAEANNGYDQVFGYIFGYYESVFSTPTRGGTYQYNNGSYCYYFIPASLKAVVITGGSSIGSYAFRNCTSLASVTIGNNVTSIGDYAFENCSSLTSVVIGDSVTSIGWGAFSYCKSLTSVTIGDSVTRIGSSAFYRCSKLTSIVIPDSVTSIGSGAFSGCSKLTSVEIPDSVTSIGAEAFYNCDSLYSVVIGDSVTSIGSYAFRGCTSLTSIEIPNSVTSIGSYAFYNCSSLTSIEIPDGVTSIGSSAFSGCSSLTSITLPFVGAKAGVKDSDTYQYPFGYIFGTSSYDGSYGANQSYYGSSTSSTTSTTYYIPSNLKSVTVTGSNILYGAFSNCKIEDLSIVAGKVSFGKVFGGSSLIPDTLQKINILGGTINSQYFDGCTNITNINILSEKVVIEQNAFDDCVNLNFNKYSNGYYLGNDENEFLVLIKVDTTATVCVVNDNAKIIAEGAFEGCTLLTSVEIPNSVTSIGSYAFYGCSKLTSIEIPDGVTSIGYGAFYGCSSLTSITLPFVGAKAGVTSSNTYQYPFGYIFGTSSYTGSYGAKQYYYGRSTSNTTYSTYYIPSSLKSVTITGGNILYGAFYNCSSLTSVIIGDSVTSIDDYAFSGCSSLQYNLKGGLKYLGNKDNCYLYLAKTESSVATVTIDDNCKFIGPSAFYNCSSLTSIIIPDSVISIGSYAFYNCNGLTSIIIPDSVTSIGEWAFYCCSSLTSVVIPDSVESIGYRAFYYCSSLTSVVIGDSVTSIGERAFSGCTNISAVRIPIAVVTMGSDIFDGCSTSLKIYCATRSRPDGWSEYWNRWYYWEYYENGSTGYPRYYSIYWGY